ncbi:MAG: thioredoxin domain-containing protein [Phycisphaerales bacterium]|nr:MAG: thioredoxin domain-containing protein [Phycisphaerales bacterium]
MPSPRDHDAAEPRAANRLAQEASPYLLQHAHNPVDWRPWGREAFEEARRRDVPIFLSIGYSTCYWCHVMERESFESERIARLMNERFVCVKVDREERPEVDDVYMCATVTMTGRGGWPMSVFLEPGELRPFWCGTYFPSEPRPELGGMPSFPQVLEGMSGAWRERRSEVLEQAEQLAEAVREQLGGGGEAGAVRRGVVAEALATLLRMFDRTHGGFGGAPKFPQPVFLDLLLTLRAHAGDDATRAGIDQGVRTTLDKMAAGGIHDQVGGGFHRYAVDGVWLVPHFEKMLYDNAQLASVYAVAGAVYGDDAYVRTARRTLAYVQREITHPDGAFFSAQDAEVDGREGLNYLWLPGEVRGAMGDTDDAAFAIRHYGLDRGTNFQDPHHLDEPARNVLRLDDVPERLSQRFGEEPAAFTARLDRINAELLGVRDRRKQPHLDDKVLTSWNGLMIAAFAQASEVFADAGLYACGARAAGFVLERMIDADGELRRSWRDGRLGPLGVLEDSANLARGLLALHRARAHASSDPGDRYLLAARDVLAKGEAAFGDGHGGFFDTRDGQGDLFVRTRSTHDGATPSGASAMLAALTDMAIETGEADDRERALAALRSMAGAIHASPVGCALATASLVRLIAAGFGDERSVRDGAGSERGASPARAAEFTPVEIYADEERLKPTEDEPAVFHIVMRIAEGYHVVAAEPVPGEAELELGLQGFRAGLIPGSGSGVAVYANYPEGEVYRAPVEGSPEIRVYTGEVEIVVAVERRGDWAGRPLLGATFQACSGTECLRPVTVELDVAIDEA